jgi:E3 ubiquitin-protein ligase NRDP1
VHFFLISKKCLIFFLCSSWSSALQLARVTHWGGMISTPDVVLQAAIKSALIESGCPINITDELMENAHERHWPEGLSTLGIKSLFCYLIN